MGWRGLRLQTLVVAWIAGPLIFALFRGTLCLLKYIDLEKRLDCHRRLFGWCGPP